VSALLEAGCSVCSLSLDVLPTGARHDSMDVRLGDVTEMAAIQRAMQGVDAVVHFNLKT
jgi:uncharacterized protein YbjT (DUF2867 family)